MKKTLFIFSCLLITTSFCFAQQSFDDFKKSADEMFDNFVQVQNEKFERFTAQQNAEFAAFVEQQWQLFDNFCKSSSPFTKPKLQEAPIAPKTNSGWSLDFNEVIDFVVKSIPTKTDKTISKNSVSDVIVNFYGEKLSFSVKENLRLRVGSSAEYNVANYLRAISKYSAETTALWNDIATKADKFGLNEWGRYLLTKSIAEKLFSNENDRVAFCFYMLRNMGGYKVKVGRSVDDGNLVLLLAIDNSKEVYNYGFFNFNENGRGVKYYLVYGKDSGSVYTYELNNQDLSLAQIGLDFNKTLSIGKCDRLRELKIARLNSTINFQIVHLTHFAILEA